MGEIQKYLESLSQRPELNRSNGYTVHPAVDTVLTAMLARGRGDRRPRRGTGGAAA